MSYDDFFVPRIVLLSDGEADNPSAVKGPADFAKSQGIIIDSIGLLSQSERGKGTLEEIAKTTAGNFILPGDLENFIAEFVRLSKKKHATKVEDIILCLDVSGSMGETFKGSTKQKIEALKESVRQFSEKKLGIDPRDRVGVAVFGSSDPNNIAVLLKAAPYSKATLESVIQKLSPQDGTPLDKGINLSIEELDVERKRKSFKIEMAQVINNIEQVPRADARCKYCEATNKPQPGIDGENWCMYEGVRRVHVFRCPACGALYHGMCFDKHVTSGSNAGVCYGCNSVIGVGESMHLFTPEVTTSDTGLHMCSKCNEPLPPGARFCSFCGATVTSGETSLSGPNTLSTNGFPGAPKVVTTYSGTPMFASPQPADFYQPEGEELVACPSCGYSCQKSWGTCPICSSELG